MFITKITYPKITFRSTQPSASLKEHPFIETASYQQQQQIARLQGIIAELPESSDAELDGKIKESSRTPLLFSDIELKSGKAKQYLAQQAQRLAEKISSLRAEKASDVLTALNGLVANIQAHMQLRGIRRA